MTSTKCSNCQFVVEQAFEFCPNCGTKIIHELPKQEESSSVPTETVSHYKEKHSSGIKTTFIWSIILSLITLLAYTFKGMANVDVVAQTLIQGAFARPLIVLLIAFIISLFFSEKKKIGKFNSACTFIMAILTVGEIGRWFVIGGA